MSCVGWVAAEHSHTGTKFGATERHHVLTVPREYLSKAVGLSPNLPNVRRNYLTMIRICVGEDILDQVISILVTRDCNVH